MEEERFNAIVVGGGLAGLACAYRLASSSLKVLVVERGRFAGAKNTWGGAFCGPVLGDLIPNFWAEAPIERIVSRHIFSFVSKGRCASFSYDEEPSDKPISPTFTILRSRFDKWFAQKAAEKGAIVATGLEATELLRNANRVEGIKCGDEDFRADVVVLCDGVSSVLARKSGLRKELHPVDVKQGVKEIVKLSPEAIEQRFNLRGNQGISWQFVGSCTRGLPGGAFLYTNKDCLSLGVVVSLSAIVENKVSASELLEEFKNSYPVSELIKDGKLEEYSAHLIPVSGVIPKLYFDGLLVAGDAAGMVVGTGLILEGGNFAVASGIAAAETVQKCAEKRDFSAEGLAQYQDSLENSFVLKDLKTFRRAPHFLARPRIYNEYPDIACSFLEQALSSSNKPRKSSWRLLRETVRGKVSLISLVKDTVEGIRSI